MPVNEFQWSTCSAGHYSVDYDLTTGTVNGGRSIPTGIGIYLYVGNLSIAEYVFSVPSGELAIFQVRMLSIFSRSLGAVFALAGLATIALAKNRLSVGKEAYRMAKVIQSRAEEKQA